MSTVNGVQVRWQDLYLPANGQWRHDAVLTDGTAPAKGSDVSIEVGGLVLQGKVYRSWNEIAGRPHVVSVGGLGWLQSVARPQSWHTDSGVPLRAVLSTIASAAGEAIEQPADVIIGEYYDIIGANEQNPRTYANVLDSLVQDGHLKCWRVDPDGKTRFVPRTSAEVTDRATFKTTDPASGALIYGLDDPKQFLPGNTVDGHLIDRVNFYEVEGNFTAHVYTPSAVKSLRDQLLDWLRAEFSDRIRSYIVQECHEDGRCDLVPLPDAKHYPEMRNVKQWSFGGAVYRAEKGDECVVVFRDWKKTRPCILGCELGDGPYTDAAYKGATVEVLLPPLSFSGTMNGQAVTGVMISPVSKTLGVVTTGSLRVGLRLS